jgi:hypothetical protein
MSIGRGKHGNPTLPGAAHELLQVRDDLFGAGDIESAGGQHEVYLSINVHEDYRLIHG